MTAPMACLLFTSYFFFAGVFAEGRGVGLSAKEGSNVGTAFCIGTGSTPPIFAAGGNGSTGCPFKAFFI